MFQSSPGPKAGRCTAAGWTQGSAVLVSILARPEGRALPNSHSKRRSPPRCFNPRPARRPGAASGAALSPCLSRCFNPRPARRPGAARLTPRPTPTPAMFQSSPGPKAGRCAPLRAGCQPDGLEVSILARPEGRALHVARNSASSMDTTRFNPRPARRPGAALRRHLTYSASRALLR